MDRYITITLEDSSDERDFSNILNTVSMIKGVISVDESIDYRSGEDALRDKVVLKLTDLMMDLGV